MTNEWMPAHSLFCLLACLFSSFVRSFIRLFASCSVKFNFAHKWNELEMDSVCTLRQEQLFMLVKWNEIKYCTFSWIYEMKNVHIFELLVVFYDFMLHSWCVCCCTFIFCVRVCLVDVLHFPICIRVCGCQSVLACRVGKSFLPRKQCFYSNCYSVAHSWHYFPTLIKFHPNHNSNHVGALLQSLSNMRIITIEPTSCHHRVRLYDMYIRVHTHTHTIHTCIYTYISDISMTFPKSQFHTSIIIYLYVEWKREQEAEQQKEKKKKSWLVDDRCLCFILGCV